MAGPWWTPAERPAAEEAAEEGARGRFALCTCLLPAPVWFENSPANPNGGTSLKVSLLNARYCLLGGKTKAHGGPSSGSPWSGRAFRPGAWCRSGQTGGPAGAWGSVEPKHKRGSMAESGSAAVSSGSEPLLG